VSPPSELPTGLHLGVPPEQYHALELGMVSCSAIAQLDVSPLTYLTWVRGELANRDTEALRLGGAFHCAAGEPERFADAYAVAPAFGHVAKHDASGTTSEQAKANKTRRDEWRQNNAGKIHLSSDEGAMLTGMVDSLRRHPKIAKILACKGNVAESVVRWDDRALGLPCKARPDLLVPELGLAVDLKSTADATERAFTRQAFDLQYDRQAAHYRDGLLEIGWPIEHFLFVAVQKTPPYLVGLYVLHAEDEEIGRQDNRVLMGWLAKCLVTNEWPGLSEDVITIERPRWARRAA